MYQTQHTAKEVSEELTKFDSHNGVKPGVDVQSFREDNSSESTLSKNITDQNLDLDLQPQLSQRNNFATKFLRLVCCSTSALKPKNYENTSAVETTTQ